MAKALGNNPLLREEPVLTEKDVETIKEAQKEFVNVTFKVRRSYINKLRDYAYTERIEQKEIIDELLGNFLSTINDEDLLDHRPPKDRKKRG